MQHFPPSVEELAQRVLEQEGTGRGDTLELVEVAERICVKLQRPLDRRVGPAQCRAMLTLALTFAKADFSWLAPVSIGRDGRVEGLRQAAGQQRPDAVAAAVTALVTALVGLASTLLGTSALLAVLAEVWPELSLEDIMPEYPRSPPPSPEG